MLVQKQSFLPKSIIITKKIQSMLDNIIILSSHSSVYINITVVSFNFAFQIRLQQQELVEMVGASLQQSNEASSA